MPMLRVINEGPEVPDLDGAVLGPRGEEVAPGGDAEGLHARLVSGEPV